MYQQRGIKATRKERGFLPKAKARGFHLVILVNVQAHKRHQEAKDFARARFTTAIHYVKRFYTKEEALKLFEDRWEELNRTEFPYD